MAALGLVLGFIAYLIQLVHLPVEQATFIGVSTGTALLVILLMPKATLRLLGDLRELNKRLRAADSA